MEVSARPLSLCVTRISRIKGARGRWVINHSAPTVPSWAAPCDEAVSILLLLSPISSLYLPFFLLPVKVTEAKCADFHDICRIAYRHLGISLSSQHVH